MMVLWIQICVTIVQAAIFSEELKMVNIVIVISSDLGAQKNR